MNKLRNRFERFCFKHRSWGIPNLMLYILIGTGLVYLVSFFNDDYILYSLLCFDRQMILRGQVWRLITFIFTDFRSNPLITIIFLVCYYSIARHIEQLWGTFRFNLYYFCGVLLMDIYCMIFGGMATPEYLHLSMFLAYATLYPDAQFLLFFFIPVRAWILAIVDLALTLYGLIFYPFPMNFFGVIALANYFLFFGGDIINVLPPSLRRKLMNKRHNQPAKFVTIPFTKAKAAEKENAPYHHRCTVCGRTDLTDPNMEFRYCSRCNGYYCYCQEHIRNHSHIE